MAMGNTSVLADSMHFQGTLLGGDIVDVHGSIAALSSNIFVEGVPCNSLHVVIVLREFEHAFAFTNDISEELGACEIRHSPSVDEKIRAQLSVEPAMMYSPVGLHARSYTCMVVQLKATYETYEQVRTKHPRTGK